MKLVVFVGLLVTLYILFFFVMHFFQKNYLNNFISKKYFIIIIIIYISGLSFFSYSLTRLFLNPIYTKKYDVKSKTAVINSLNSEIEQLKNDIDNTNILINEKSNENLSQEIEKLQKDVNDLKKEKEKQNSILSQRKNEYEKLRQEFQNIKASTEIKINDFPLIRQFPSYPNGCEIIALQMLLKYHGVNVSAETLANELNKGPAPYYEEKVRYGADPEVAFVGDPRLTNGGGYGVYQKPIIKLANKYKSGIKDISGSSLNKVLSIVKSGKPVQVWASINLKELNDCASWIDKETGKRIDWKCGFHSMVVIGYNYSDIIIADPYYGTVRYYSKSRFERIYNTLGRRAIYYD